MSVYEIIARIGDPFTPWDWDMMISDTAVAGRGLGRPACGPQIECLRSGCRRFESGGMSCAWHGRCPHDIAFAGDVPRPLRENATVGRVIENLGVFPVKRKGA